MRLKIDCVYTYITAMVLGSYLVDKNEGLLHFLQRCFVLL